MLQKAMLSSYSGIVTTSEQNRTVVSQTRPTSKQALKGWFIHYDILEDAKLIMLLQTQRDIGLPNRNAIHDRRSQENDVVTEPVAVPQ